MSNLPKNTSQRTSDTRRGELPLAQAQRDPLKFAKTIGLAVSHDVQLTILEKRIVDLPHFQRLRRVRQLGLACLVYPSAVHTRYEHSLGTLKMASEMLGHIEQNCARDKRARISDFSVSEDQIILTRLYALLHDITHIPFGHTLEDEVKVFKRHDENPERIENFLGTKSEVARVMREELGDTRGGTLHRRFLSIYTWDKQSDLKGDEFVYDVVSNTVCADLLDYIKRDNLYCNLRIEIGYRFIKYLHLQLYEGRPRVFVRIWKSTRYEEKAVRRDILTDLSRLLEARYLVAERVYFHHTKIIAGAMLGRAVEEVRLVERDQLTEAKLYDHSDDTLLDWLRRRDVPVAAKLAQGVWDRDLYKLVHVCRLEDFTPSKQRDQVIDLTGNAHDEVTTPSQRRLREDMLAELIGGDAGDVLLYAVAEGGNRKPAEMIVEWEGKCRI